MIAADPLLANNSVGAVGTAVLCFSLVITSDHVFGRKTVEDKKHTIASILRSTDYGLDIFDQSEIEALQLYDKGGLFESGSKLYLRDFISGKERLATPEEIVRQLFLYKLI